MVASTPPAGKPQGSGDRVPPLAHGHLAPTVAPGLQQGFNEHVLSDRATRVEIEVMGLDT